MKENVIQDKLIQDSGTHQIGDNPLARKYRFSRYLILALLIASVLLGFSELDKFTMIAARTSILLSLFVVGVRIYKKDVLPLAYLNIYSIIIGCICDGVIFANAGYWQWAWSTWIVLDAIIYILVYKHIVRCGIPYAVLLYFAFLILEFFNVMLFPQVLINSHIPEVFIYLIRLLSIVIVILTWMMLRYDAIYKEEARYKLEMPELYLSYRDVFITIISLLLAGALCWLSLTYGASIPSIL